MVHFYLKIGSWYQKNISELKNIKNADIINFFLNIFFLNYFSGIAMTFAIKFKYINLYFQKMRKYFALSNYCYFLQVEYNYASLLCDLD